MDVKVSTDFIINYLVIFMDGIERIRVERIRQTSLGFNHDHDIDHKPGELTAAAICYASVAGANPSTRAAIRSQSRLVAPRGWPWELLAWKPGNDDAPESRIRELEKAGALIAAEIDRLLVDVSVDKAWVRFHDVVGS